MKRFDYIVIEASGICEPAPIAQTICSIPSLGPQYIENGILRLDSIVTVVDALRMKDEFSNGSDLMKKNIDEEDLASLVIQQIEFCNIILLNKAAEVEPKELEHLKQIIRAIQPKAEIFECNYGDVDLNLIVNTKKFDWETVSTSAGWIQEIESERNEEHEEDDVEEAHEHHHHHHDHDEEDEHEHHHHDHDEHDHDHDEHEHHHHHDHDEHEGHEHVVVIPLVVQPQVFVDGVHEGLQEGADDDKALPPVEGDFLQGLSHVAHPVQGIHRQYVVRVPGFREIFPL